MRYIFVREQKPVAEGNMSDLSIDTELARKILTGFIKTEITRSGF